MRRYLHDGLGPQLAALTLKIETIRNRFTGEDGLDDLLLDLPVRTQGALSDIRRLVYGLRPPALDELGLVAAINQAAAELEQDGEGHTLRIRVNGPDSMPPLAAAVEVATYRIVREALTNVLRHAEASECEITISFTESPGKLNLRIVDDGHGIPAHARAGVGMVSMRERAEELGGNWTIDRSAKGGTSVTVELPCFIGGVLPEDAPAEE